jgi:hypothetical protein
LLRLLLLLLLLFCVLVDEEGLQSQCAWGYLTMEVAK